MRKWRDELAALTRFEQDAATGHLKANGQWLTDEHALTPYGQEYFRNELRVLQQCVRDVDEEIAIFRDLIKQGGDPEEVALREKILARSLRDREDLLDYKAYTEGFFARFANAANAVEYAE